MSLNYFTVGVLLPQGSKRRRRNSQDTTSASDGARDNQNVDPAARKKAGMQKVIEVMQSKDQLPLSDLISEVNVAMPTGDSFTRAELMAALSALDDDNKIMFYDDMVHKV